MKFALMFSPPMSGFEGRFNTFRLGMKLSRILTPGETILLIDSKTSRVFAEAVVESAVVGTLKDMADEHAYRNHNQRSLDAATAPQRLITNMIKRYGPHKCSETSKVTVLYLRRLE